MNAGHFCSDSIIQVGTHNLVVLEHTDLTVLFCFCLYQEIYLSPPDAVFYSQGNLAVLILNIKCRTLSAREEDKTLFLG